MFGRKKYIHLLYIVPMLDGATDPKGFPQLCGCFSTVDKARKYAVSVGIEDSELYQVQILTLIVDYRKR